MSPTPDYQCAYDLVAPSEGNVPWCYLDTKGFVTVGVGNLLATVEDAMRLPFVLRGTTTPASAADIAADWNAVKNSKKGQRASYYKALTRCDLPADKILSLFRRRVDEFCGQLAHAFPAFPVWPLGPRLATLDWVFNCGVGKPGGDGLLGTIHLKAALYAQDWKAAAAACHRLESSDRRNAGCRELYLEGTQ